MRPSGRRPLACSRRPLERDVGCDRVDVATQGRRLGAASPFVDQCDGNTLASRRTTPAPMPPAPPVTTAIFPSKSANRHRRPLSLDHELPLTTSKRVDESIVRLTDNMSGIRTWHLTTPAPEIPADLASQVERVAAPLREQVFDLLRREIVEMRLRPGQRLVERELIERIGVSRTTIREALRQLAAEGLVTTIPQKGAIVAIPSPKEATEVYEVRALLEGAASREFAERLERTGGGVAGGVRRGRASGSRRRARCSARRTASTTSCSRALTTRRSARSCRGCRRGSRCCARPRSSSRAGRGSR